MTEEELRREILRAAGPVAGRADNRADDRRQPPFVEMVLERHPEEPFDYDARRREQLDAALGEPDKIYRPALGAPFVEISRHPVPAKDAAERAGEVTEPAAWIYVTSGMSDFPQLAADGSERRTELATATRLESPLAVNLLHSLALAPFADGTALEGPEVRHLTEPCFAGFEHVLLYRLTDGKPDGDLDGPPRPALPSEIDLDGEPVSLYFVSALAPEEFERASRGPIADWLERFLAEVDPWLLDERFGLEAVAAAEEGAVAPSVGGLGCLEEATDSPCPQCGGELHEVERGDNPMARSAAEEPEAMLVCSRCGWTAMASAAEHTGPYLWAAERFRRVFGSERVEIDALPDGGAVVLRLKLPDERPIIVELKNAELDINRQGDPTAALEEKLARVEEYLAS